MLKKLLVLIFSLISYPIFTQIGFSENIIPLNSSYSLQEIHHADIDGDGDLDLITNESNQVYEKILWHENTNGLGLYGVEKEIMTTERDARSITVADLNGDGKNDVIGLLFDLGEVYWQKNNENGLGDFSSKITIDDSAYYARSITPGDIDGDGDIDLIVACGSLATSSIENNVILYRNYDGLGNFIREVISKTEDVTSVLFTDIDGDSDLDIVSGNFFSGGAYWYENIDGLGHFGTSKKFSTLSSITSIGSADLDNDGDNDIILSSNNSYNIVWYENTNGTGNFTSHNIIGYNEETSSKILPVDLNNDGKIDIISLTEDSNKIVWYENTDGLGVFAMKQLISENLFNPLDITAGDFNADGKIDVAGVSFPGPITLAWYSNDELITNKVVGKISLDTDVNGCDPSDLEASNIMIIADNGSEKTATFSLKNGQYQLFPKEGNYNININSNLLNYYTVSPNSYNHNFAGTGTIETDNFCLKPISGVNDLSISISPLEPSRPGFDCKYLITYQNVGPTILTGEISFEYDNEKVIYKSSNIPLLSQNSNSLQYSFTNLNPSSKKEIEVIFNVLPPPIVEINNILKYTATISPINEDYSKNDNVHVLEQTVVGSFDPNDIQVAEGKSILIDEINNYLHYTIRFQNTGNFYATFVKITNDLSDKLDWTTFQLISTSHSNKVEIKNENQIEFFFQAIYLPASINNEPKSHGYITYKIKPKNTVKIGDVINNHAKIYFDYNSPIITNTVNTEIVKEAPLNENLNLEKDFNIYPNPVSDILTIDTNYNLSETLIFNNLGQKILRFKGTRKINVSKLNKGVYHIMIFGLNGEILNRTFLKN